jgi:hypothetical protein
MDKDKKGKKPIYRNGGFIKVMDNGTKENEQVKPDAAKAETAQESVKPKAQSEPAKTEAVKEEAKTSERPANCPVCNKSMKKKWYYRNNKYYCCKGCWKQDLKKSAETPETKPA